eukprot:g1696.t1
MSCWSQTRSFLKEMENCYTGHVLNDRKVRDRETLKDISAVQSDLHSNMLGQRNDAREMLTNLLHEMREISKSAVRNEPSVAHEKRLTQLRNELRETSESIARLTEEKETCWKIVDELKEKKAHVEKEISDLESRTQEEMPVAENALSLYANITKIKWETTPKQTEASSDQSQNQVNTDAMTTSDTDLTDENIIKGVVTDPDTGSVKKFSIDSTQKTSFEIANLLWDLCDN